MISLLKTTLHHPFTAAHNLAVSCVPNSFLGQAATVTITGIALATIGIKYNKNRLLWLGAACNSLMMMKLALMAGATNVNERNKKGDTPLHLAYKKGDLKFAHALIKVGADVNLKNKEGLIPQDYAIEKGGPEKTTMPSRKISTPLIPPSFDEKAELISQAIKNGKTEKAIDLIKEITITYEFNFTIIVGLISLAINMNNIKITLELINKTDKKAWWQTLNDDFLPLHAAIKKNYTIIALTLLDKGISIDDKDNDENFPIDVAIKKGNKTVAIKLFKHGCKLFSLYKAISLGKTDIALEFIELYRSGVKIQLYKNFA